MQHKVTICESLPRRTYDRLSSSLRIKNNKLAKQNLLTVQNPTCQSVSRA